LVWLFVLAFDYSCIPIPVTEKSLFNLSANCGNDDAGLFGAAVRRLPVKSLRQLR
jgi:hypothetical protein